MREREYCSDRCRQRAYRANKKQTQEIERLVEGIYGPPDPQARRDEWRFERSRLLQACKVLQSERDLAQAEADLLQNRLAMAEEEIISLRSLVELTEKVTQDQLADKEAEIVRLNVLLEGQSKRTSKT
jgi:hypothetical protein